MFDRLKKMIESKDYKNYRWFFTSEGKLVIGGKNDEQNEMVLKYFSKTNYIVMHTKAAGSPFMILQSDNPSQKDIKECAIFCACFSKEWKYGKKLIDLDIFYGRDIYKNKDMKIGTFGVKNKKEIKVKPELMIIIQKGKIRAVPNLKREEENLTIIRQGKMSKEEAAEKIARKIKDKFLFPVSKEEIMMAIPSGNMEIK
ncbi:MAG: NFACT RNA binding domain-containing protein [Nanoarchaeota archaeon]